MKVQNESIRNFKISWRWYLWHCHVRRKNRHWRKGLSHITFVRLMIKANCIWLQVAIKKMKKKYYNWDEAMKLREVQSLRLKTTVEYIEKMIPYCFA